MSVGLLIAACVLLITVGLGSVYFLGPNNPVEQESEKILIDVVEAEIHTTLPSKSVIDTSTETNEAKN